MRIIKYTFFIAGILLIAFHVFAQSNTQKTADTSGEVIVLTKKDFIEKIYNYEKTKDRFVYEGTLPCIIDFYADWCGPCKKVDPILKELAKEYKGKMIIYKINVDNERELAKAFGISSIPTYFFISVKGELQYALGALPRENFVKVIEEYILKN